MLSKLTRSSAANAGVRVLLALAMATFLLAGTAGVAAAAPADSASDNPAANSEHPQEDKEQNHQRAENYDGGQSHIHALNGLANACQTPASDSPEGSTWCQA